MSLPEEVEISPQERIVGRLRGKIEKRDTRIAGLERRIADLESRLATRILAERQLEIDVKGAVQDALGIGRDTKIVEIKSTTPADEQTIQRAQMYEYLRTLNPREFGELWDRNVRGQGPFDELVLKDMKEKS